MTPTDQPLSGSHNTHSRLAPSASKRWTTCTASVDYIRRNADLIPADTGSVYSREGTEAHDHAAAVLLRQTHIEDIPKSFRPHVAMYVDHCRSLVGPDTEVLVESSVPLFYQPGDTGTVDFAVVSEDLVAVRDLKYGAGVQVDAVENTQLAIYALSLIRDLQADGLYSFRPDTLVSMGIVQPRYRGDEPIKVWELPLVELERFAAEQILAPAEDIKAGSVEFAPSEDACQWCPCKGFCQARAVSLSGPLGDNGLDDLAFLPDLTKKDLSLPTPERIAAVSGPLAEETMVALWNRRKEITRWLDDIEEWLTDRAKRGTPAAGTKLVQGRPGNRKWADETAAERWLRKLPAAERFVRTLISPTVAEEKLDDLLGSNPRLRARFDALVARADGRPVLAPESDKRPAIGGDLAALDMEGGIR